MTNQSDELNKKGIFPEKKEKDPKLEEKLCDLSESEKLKNYNKEKHK